VEWIRDVNITQYKKGDLSLVINEEAIETNKNLFIHQEVTNIRREIKTYPSQSLLKMDIYRQRALGLIEYGLGAGIIGIDIVAAICLSPYFLTAEPFQLAAMTGCLGAIAGGGLELIDQARTRFRRWGDVLKSYNSTYPDQTKIKLAL
jgi:hypothetical protein